MTLDVAPPAPWLLGAPLTLTANATDDIGVTLVAWQVDGETVAMDTTSPFSATWDSACARQVHDPGAGVRRGREKSGCVRASDGDGSDCTKGVSTAGEFEMRRASEYTNGKEMEAGYEATEFN